MLPRAGGVGLPPGGTETLYGGNTELVTMSTPIGKQAIVIGAGMSGLAAAPP